MCISFASTCSKRIIACSTVTRRVSQSIEETWRHILSFNSETVCMFPLLTWSLRNSQNQKSQRFYVWRTRKTPWNNTFASKVCNHLSCSASRCTIIHEHSSLEPLSVTQIGNDVVLKEIVIMWTRDGIPLLTLRSILLRKKRTRKKNCCKITPNCNVIEFQRTLMHNVRTCTNTYATISTIYC